ncbi:MAG TPA: pilus assembly protein TadG-related protein [Ilumatobacter sp.]|nr:pilus assembly protein TadG-related protein [Ilumatobacter sp.]
MNRRAVDPYRLNGDRGSITAFVAVIAFALVMVAGMAYDGGTVIATHLDARAHAQKAARAGAQQIDQDTLRAADEIALDPDAATAAALTYLTQAGATGTVEITGATITVTVTATAPLRILPGSDRTIVATNSATATGAPP